MINQDILFKEIKDKTGSVGIITLNRPQALNALTIEMVKRLDAQLAVWQQDGGIKAVIIRGEGERAFCAGGDIRFVYEAGQKDPEKALEFFWHEYRMNRRLYHFNKPYIALLDGITMGGGLGISVHGSHRVATERLVLAMPETGIGFFPDIGGSYFLPRCLGKVGIYLGLTGEKIKYQDALDLKFVNHAIASDKQDLLIEVLSQADLGASPYTAVSKIIQQCAIEEGPSELMPLRPRIDQCFSESTVEDILRVLKQDPTPWAKHTVETLLAKSPTSLKVTLRELQEGEKLDFDACMAMEYRLSAQFMQHPDFYEGVRAAIIDKDRNPKWKPAHLADVTDEQIDQFFTTKKRELSFV